VTAIAAAFLALTVAAPARSAEPPRHLIYLHGRIVQERQSARPVNVRFGAYELEKIRSAFRERGFTVHSEIRPRTATVEESADRVAAEVKRLLASGVPVERIAVVGASMGASIAFLAAERLQLPGLRVATLGACLFENAKGPVGHLLAIREESDDLIGPCRAWNPAAAPPGLRARELVLHTGLSHGFLYRPLPEWVEPVAAFAASRD